MGSRVKSAALLLFLFLILLLQAGCISISRAPEKGSGGGLSGVPTATPRGGEPIQDITSRNVPKVSLADVMAALPSAAADGGIDLRGLVTTRIWGYGVDSSGLARTWVFGMQGEGRTLLLSFSEGQFRELDIPTTLPQEEVKIREIVTPEDLFRRNLNKIVQEMNRLRVGESDITLDANSYQIIIHSPSESSTLSFSARTGELSTSP
jgi:hypothetical protein